ncbi:trypsin-like peptidase domain-containing protein [Streptomyces sp. NPDC008001]|uniref:trypsin-like peptidase domain-containing protein n=1 Tax=Streptomyces sp. NPDC008001 TaxID=3364804 RepID=UPI0036E8EAC4
MDDGKTRTSASAPQWWSRPRPPAAAEEHEGPQFLDAGPSSPAPDTPEPGRPAEAETRPLPAYGQESAAQAPVRAESAPAEAAARPLPGQEPDVQAPAPVDSVPAEAETRSLPAYGYESVAQAPVPAESAPAAVEAPGQESSPQAPGSAAAPLHAPDPYGTPPYGQPGPWAPAPPVQRPVTPPQGTVLPPAAPAQGAPYPAPGMTPPHGTPAPPVTPPHGTPVPPAAMTPPPYPHGAHPAPAPAGPWRYDPWGAPRAAGPGEAGQEPARRGRLVAGALLVALVAGGIGGGVGAYLERDGVIGRHVELPQAGADRSARAPGSIAGIAARTLPGVVTIHVRGGSDQGTGTGFVLDKEGRILTNNHVVEPAGSAGDISVTFSSGQTAKATVVGRDSSYDLAVIKVSGVSGLTPLALGNSDSVRVGDSVIAIGAPYDLAGTVTTGIISAKERPITAGGQKGDGSDVSYVDALQTDAPINPGNSGGPLVDSEARVIGINSAIRSAGDSSELGGGQGGSIGLGFAIPINQAKRVAEELINTGKATHPVIGVTLDMEYSGDGARVNTKSGDNPAVTPGGPGDKAGLQPRDVIKKVDGVAVHSGQELIVKIRSHRPGDRLTLTVERDGSERSVGLTLGSASAR